MDLPSVISPSGEPQPDVSSSIPLLIQFNPGHADIGAREVDLVFAVLDDIVKEMQRLSASEAGVRSPQSDQAVLAATYE